MDFKIQVLLPVEIDQFWPVFAQVLETEFPGYTKNVVRYFLEKTYTRTAFYYWLINNWKTILVAKKDNEIIGFAVIDQPYGGVSFCRWLGVKKDYQKKGIGTKLIEFWIELAKKEGCHKIEIASQPEAKQFYEKIGLFLEGKRNFSYFGIDQYIFGKVLGKPTDEVMTKY